MTTAAQSKFIELKHYPGFGILPEGLQKMLVGQVDKASDIFAENLPCRVVTDKTGNLKCDCAFFSECHLPCKHIFHADMYGNKKILTADLVESICAKFAKEWFGSLANMASCESTPGDPKNPALDGKPLASIFSQFLGRMFILLDQEKFKEYQLLKNAFEKI